MRYSKKEFEAQYPDDDACLEAVFQDRFGDLKFCPRCGAETKFYRIKSRPVYSCMHCRYQLSPLADTIFRKTTTPLKDWFYAIYLVSVSKNGISASELSRHLGCTYKTSWRMLKQIRTLMQQENDKLSGDVETDETYAPSRRHPRKIGRSQKQVIFGVVERNGRIAAQHVKSSGSRVLLPIIEERVEKNSHIFSDEFGVYRTLSKRGYSHTTVNHSKLEYVRGTAHTNTIEGFWSQLKRSIDGTYHAVSPKYLQTYVDEFAFRYNFRDVAVGPVLLDRALKRV